MPRRRRRFFNQPEICPPFSVRKVRHSAVEQFHQTIARSCPAAGRVCFCSKKRPPFSAIWPRHSAAQTPAIHSKIVAVGTAAAAKYLHKHAFLVQNAPRCMPKSEPATPPDDPLLDEHWLPTEGAAYRAALLVTHEGKCAKEIALAIYGHCRPRELGRVARLLKFAAEKNLLRLTAPINETLQLALTEKFGGQKQFHVVNNDHVAYVESPGDEAAFRGDAVCRCAAEIIAARIHRLLTDPIHQHRPIVIANAGGYAISRILHFLAGMKLTGDTPDPRRLLFLSLNSATIPNNYEKSANVLAVEMAKIFGGEHLAICSIWPRNIQKRYAQAIRDIDLLICGAGSDRGLLFTWLKENTVDRHENNAVVRTKIKLPAKACGDICLIPVNPDGEELEFAQPEEQAEVARVLSPHPTHHQLQTLAGQDKVIYVAMGYENDDRRRPQPPARRPATHSKLAITKAILQQSLTRTCILGATLARDLLDSP